MSSSEQERAARAFFGRRKGKRLRETQAELVHHLLPQLRVSVDEILDLTTLFPSRCTSYALEIGFGGGEHLLHQARLNPEIGFIGCEPFVNGMAKMLAAIEQEDIDNIRLFDADALFLLEKIPPRSLARVFLLYPDPWPKRRQHKRRFISDSTLASISKVLEINGEFRFATDIDHYAGWTLAHVFRSKNLVWAAESPETWRHPWPHWIETRYEAKARREGRFSSYFTFKRV